MYYPQIDYRYFLHLRNEEWIIQVLQNCAAICEYTRSEILRTEDARNRKKQLKLLDDCMDICNLTAKSIKRQSENSNSFALLCAQICEDCGIHCLHEQPDALSHRCGQICLDCSIECRNYAGAES